MCMKKTVSDLPLNRSSRLVTLQNVFTFWKSKITSHKGLQKSLVWKLTEHLTDSEFNTGSHHAFQTRLAKGEKKKKMGQDMGHLKVDMDLKKEKNSRCLYVRSWTKQNAGRFHILPPVLMWQLFLVSLQTAKDTKDTVLVQIQPGTSTALECCITRKECQDTTRVMRRPSVAKHRIQDIQANMCLPQSSRIISIAPSSGTRKSHATCVPKVVLWNRPRGELKSSRVSGWLIATGPNV